MSEIEHGFYWVQTPNDGHTIAEYDGDWWFVGAACNYKTLPKNYIIISRVANVDNKSNEPALNIDFVSKSFYCADVLGKCNKQCEDCKDIEKD